MLAEHKAYLEVLRRTGKLNDFPEQDLYEGRSEDRIIKTLTSKVGIPEHTAHEIYKVAGKLSVWIANKILASEPNLESFTLQPNHRAFNKLTPIMDWIKVGLRNNMSDDIKNLPFDSLYQEAVNWHDNLKAGDGDVNYKEDKPIILDFRNDEGIGFYWADLETNQCTKEAERMGHCGNGMQGHRLLSLRQVRLESDDYTINTSHVTVEIDDSGVIIQLRGKSNSKPKEKYHPYIVKLLESDVVSAFMSYASYVDSSGNFSLADLQPNVLVTLLENKPNIFGGDDNQIDMLTVFSLLESDTLQENSLTKTIKDIYENGIKVSAPLSNMVNQIDNSNDISNLHDAAFLLMTLLKNIAFSYSGSSEGFQEFFELMAEHIVPSDLYINARKVMNHDEIIEFSEELNEKIVEKLFELQYEGYISEDWILQNYIKDVIEVTYEANLKGLFKELEYNIDDNHDRTYLFYFDNLFYEIKDIISITNEDEIEEMHEKLASLIKGLTISPYSKSGDIHLEFKINGGKIAINSILSSDELLAKIDNVIVNAFFSNEGAIQLGGFEENKFANIEEKLIDDIKRMFLRKYNDIIMEYEAKIERLEKEKYPENEEEDNDTGV